METKIKSACETCTHYVITSYSIHYTKLYDDSIRTFDVETQLSVEQIKKINIIPNVENKFLDEQRESFLKYIRNNFV